MRRLERQLVGLGLLVWTVAAVVASARAEEPYWRFLDGLRSRGYYDFALLYLDQLQNKPDLPQSVREVLPYERAVTLLQSVDVSRSGDAATQTLDQAAQLFEQFVQQNPDHPLAVQANLKRSQILVEKLRLAVWKVTTGDSGEQADARRQAEPLVEQARALLAELQKQLTASLKALPSYIDEKDKSLLQRRSELETALLRTELNRGLVAYYQSQLLPEGSSEARRLLQEAATQFEQVHEKYRTQVGGLYARLYQGRCLQLLGDDGAAMGVFSELLNHPGRSTAIRQIKNKAFLFRLMCLLSDRRKDYELAAQQAQQWLTQFRGPAARTPAALAVRWQLALAQEKLARQPDVSETQKQRLLQSALENAREVSRYPGEYRKAAAEKAQQLLVELRGPEAAQQPTDLPEALARAAKLVKKLKALAEQLQQAEQERPTEAERLRREQKLLAQEAEDLLRAAVEQAGPRADPRQLAQARYLLAYVDYLLRESYEAYILGEFVARHYKPSDQDDTLGQDAAYLAIAALLQAYNLSPPDQKEVDVRLIESLASLLLARWPDSSRTVDACFQVGQLYQQLRRPEKAAEWFTRVPEDSERGGEALAAAGRAYWSAYLQAVSEGPSSSGAETLLLPASDRKQQLQQWQEQAESLLKRGVRRLEQQVRGSADLAEQLALARVVLAQVQLNQGRYQECVETLTRKPRPVVQLVQVDSGSARPEQGVRSAEFASLVYQLLLRAYIGLKDIERARQTMERLEQLACASGGEAMTTVYVELGRQLEGELKRLKNAGDQQRLQEVRSAFESFLQHMAERPSQTLGSLVWLAESYSGLAEGTGDWPDKAKRFFERAAELYERILERDRQQPDFVDEKTETAVRLRLARALRRSGQFLKALGQVARLLEKTPNLLEAQVEAAYALQDWGLSDPRQNADKLRLAIVGAKLGSKKIRCWGWGQLALNLQRLLGTAKGQRKKDLEQRLYEARYNSAYCRYQFALWQESPQDKKEQLRRAKTEIVAFAAIQEDFDPAWWSRFDSLYRDILKALGEPVVALAQVEPTAAPARSGGTRTPTQATSKRAPVGAPRRTAKRKKQDTPARAFLLLVGLLFALTAGAVAWAVKTQGRSGRPVVAGAGRVPGRPSRSGTSSAGATPTARRSGRRRPPSGSSPTSSGSGSSDKPPAPRPSAGTKPAPSPRPQPPPTPPPTPPTRPRE